MADQHFEIPRLAQIYDMLDTDRSDLNVYSALVDELGAARVLDVGCGTGTFACMLANRGIEVVGLDPAGAVLDVAHEKPGADHVSWVHGDVIALPALEVDLVTMTGNVAQVFVDDEDWTTTLRACHRALRPNGYLALESRIPEDHAWLRWTREATYIRTAFADIGFVEYWVEVTEVRPGTVSFRSTYIFAVDDAMFTTDSTLRFRSLDELSSSMEEVGFQVDDVRDAPDRPGREYVILARRTT